MRAIRVAAVQCTSENGALERNLERAAPLVAEAARRGAELVLCPEFLATGYVYTEEIWDAAEAAGGPTERWLMAEARRHRIYLGACYLEAEGEDFHNTFVLAAPDGGVAGRVRKRSLPMFEGWFFRPCDGPKVIDTPVGRLGVGICNDCQTAAFLGDMIEERPDLILMPHSAPTPILGAAGRPFLRLFVEQLREAAPRTARALGVPTVMANKISAEATETALPPPLSRLRVRWRFQGFSSVCDADGRVLASVGDGEGVAVAEVTLDPGRKRRPAERPSGYWSFAPPAFARTGAFLMTALDRAGRRAYARNPRRRQRARARSGAPA